MFNQSAFKQLGELNYKKIEDVINQKNLIGILCKKILFGQIKMNKLETIKKNW